MKSENRIFSILIIVLSLWVACDQDSPTEPQNNPPEISSIIANPSQVGLMETSTLVCKASDPDGDSLEYIWTSSSGTIHGSGDIVNWVAPDSEGIFTANCKVLDGSGGETSSNVSIEVKQAIPIQGLLAFYPFNGNAQDESGHGNNGEVLGTATVNSVLSIGDNDTDRLSLPHTILKGLSNFSFSAWLKIDVFHTEGYIPGQRWLSAARQSQDNALSIYYSPNYNAWGITINDLRYVRFDENSAMLDNNWHHVLVSREGTTARLFLDGVEVGNSITVREDIIDVDPNGFIIGQEQDNVGGGFKQNQSLAGKIDNFRIYNRALGIEEVQALSNESGWGI